MADNTNGALFPNKDKKSPKAPDYTGNFTMTKPFLKAWIEEFKKDGSADELKVQLGAWIKEGKNGKYLSISVNAPFEKKAPAKNDLDSDIPF